MYVNARAIIERQVGGETEILLQVRDRPGEARRLELPGGQVAEYVGFFFRCEAEGELTGAGDGAYGHQWVSVPAVGRRFGVAPGQFDWLTQAALSSAVPLLGERAMRNK